MFNILDIVFIGIFALFLVFSRTRATAFVLLIAYAIYGSYVTTIQHDPSFYHASALLHTCLGIVLLYFNRFIAYCAFAGITINFLGLALLTNGYSDSFYLQLGMLSMVLQIIALCIQVSPNATNYIRNLLHLPNRRQYPRNP